MVTINENRLMSAVNQVFAKMKSKFCKADEMVQLLVEEGLTPEEAKQAISLARAKKVVRVCFPYIDDMHGDRCYELLTEEDREFDKWSEEESHEGTMAMRETQKAAKQTDIPTEKRRTVSKKTTAKNQHGNTTTKQENEHGDTN